MTEIKNMIMTVQLSHLLATDIGICGDESTVIDTIYLSKSPVTETTLKNDISEAFHIEIEQGRLHNTVNKLVKEHKLYRIENKLLISPQMMEDISRMTVDNENLESTALSEWAEQYEYAIKTELSTDTVQVVSGCILNFIRKFFLTHGADCYAFITGEKQKEYFDIVTIAKDITSSVSPEIAETLTPFLIGIFSADRSASQMTFLLTQLKKAVHYLSMVVDNQAQLALLKQLEGVTVYLDTTILYRLLNLQGEKRFESIRRLVEFCRTAKVELKVFQTTIEEIKRRIDYDAHVILAHPTPVNFARIGYKCRTEENYISAFWNEQQKTGVSAKDFNYRYIDILSLLQDVGIVVDDCDYITTFKLEDKKENFYNKVVNFSNSDPEFQKSTNAIIHDSECLAMVEHLQLRNAVSAIEAKTLFLSSDWGLIRLQRYDYEYKNKTDLVVLPSQLMQLFCMTTPTTDYYEAFLGLFSSSRTSFGAKSLDNAQLQEIMGRIAMYKGTTPHFAERILTSQLIQTTFAEKETEEEKYQLIDNAMISEVEQMEEEIEEKDRVLDSKDKVISLEQNNSKTKEEVIDELSRRITSLESTRSEANSKLVEAEDAISKYKQHFERRAKRIGNIKAIFRFGFGIALIVAGAIAIGACIAAMIPLTSHIVAPWFSWMGTSASIMGEPNIAIITLVATLGIAAVPCGVVCVKPGYLKLSENYAKKYNQKLQIKAKDVFEN